VGKHYDLARQMCNYWANFIASGDPNGPDASGELMPKWRAYTAQEPWGVVFRDQVECGIQEPSKLMDFLVQQYFK
jgi:para-nitrobenzyl esterase